MNKKLELITSLQTLFSSTTIANTITQKQEAIQEMTNKLRKLRENYDNLLKNNKASLAKKKEDAGKGGGRIGPSIRINQDPSKQKPQGRTMLKLNK